MRNADNDNHSNNNNNENSNTNSSTNTNTNNNEKFDIDIMTLSDALSPPQRKRIRLSLQKTPDTQSSSSSSSVEIINSCASVFGPRKRRASKVPTDPKERSLYIVNQCKSGPNKDYMNLEHLVIGENGAGHCNQCIFLNVKCVWAWKDRENNSLAKGGVITTRHCVESHFLGDTHNPHMKLYKVMLCIVCRFSNFGFYLSVMLCLSMFSGSVQITKFCWSGTIII